MPDLALFDFDGTITRTGTFIPFLYYAVSRRRILLGKMVLGPFIAAYKLKLLSSSAIRSLLVAFCFRGRREDELRVAGPRYAREHFPGVMRPDALARIEWHKARGDAVVVVSASLDVYLTDWCKERGLDVISSRLEAHGGTCTGRYDQGDCSGKEKARRIRSRYDLASYPVIFAYGDSDEDRDMLALAHRKYLCWKELP